MIICCHEVNYFFCFTDDNACHTAHSLKHTHTEHHIAFNLSTWLFSHLLLATIGALLVLVTRKIVPEFDCKALLVVQFSFGGVDETAA